MISTGPHPSSEIVLSLEGISKQYGTVQALLDVSLECRAGEIHAVVGENGSGKSTLLGVASGYVEADQGIVQIGGQILHKDSPAKALELGLGMAYQDISQVPMLTVAENLYLATSPKQRPRYWDLKDWAIQMLARFNLDDLFAEAPVGMLALAERQLLEVAKALLSDPKVLLLDEPTTALGPGEVDWLHETLLDYAARGIGIVYVSHRLPEVLSVADRVTVLRDGRSQGTHEASEMTEGKLVELMIGRPFESAFPQRVAHSADEPDVLTISDLHGGFFGPLSLSLKRGEILGVAGVEGNGQGDLFYTLSGRIPPWETKQPGWFVRAAREYFTSKDQLLTLALAAPGPEFTEFEVTRSHWNLARDVGARITAHVGVGTFGQKGKVQEFGEMGPELLKDDTTYIHCTTLNDTEIQMIVDSGGTVSLASPVEMMMDHGIPPTQRFLDRGLRPSLSVDVETNVPGDMFTQMRSIISLQHALAFERVLSGDKNAPDRITAREVLEYATIEGARANGLDHKVGTLTPGKEADIIMLRTNRINVMPINDPIGAVVWGMDTSNVDTVFVAGKAMKRNGELIGVDLNKVQKMVTESRDYVIKKARFTLPAI